MVDIKSLVSQLTTEEKASLLAGRDFWTTNPVERLNIPSLKVSDGPNGARGETFFGGITSACFPAGVSLAATFDVELAKQAGKALAEETKTKGAMCLLGPTVCLHRDPRGGRNFESYSEDPLLAGVISQHYIQGVQQEGVAATIKHYAVNESETKRLTIDCRVSQRALREIYLKPFEIAVKKADPWAVMTSYNLVNGVHADMSKFLITKVLREEWGFKGLVMSDWGGTNSVAGSLNAGHDLEMPGPTKWRSGKQIAAALESGELSQKILDERVAKNLEFIQRCGKFDNPETPAEQAINKPEHRQLIRRAGAEGIVLLKNDNNVLPLRPDALKSVAVIGLSKAFMGHGGGSAAVNAHHKITAYDALEEAVGKEVELKYAEGVRIPRNFEPLSRDVVDEDGESGWTCKIELDDGSATIRKNVPGAFIQEFMRPHLKSVTLTATFKPTISGNHYVSFACLADTAVYVDEKPVFEAIGDSADMMAMLLGAAPEERKQVQFNAGQTYKLRVKSKARAADTEASILAFPMINFRFGFLLEEDFNADLLTPAIETARSADVAVVFVGHSPVWETEGCDRDSMDLPINGSQDRLVEAIAKVNKNTIVVNSTGSPVTMNWADNVPAIVQAWFAGQESGYAIADVLLGKTNPTGKLPVTFPKRYEDTPSYGNFPYSGKLEDLHVDYVEDIFMGYRHYDRKPETVLFPFGHGLSYTSFKLSSAALSEKSLPATATFDVTVDVENTGSSVGSETVQVYVSAPSASKVSRPNKVLAGFAKARSLSPGQKVSVSLPINVGETFSYWDEEKYSWVVEKGKYTVLIGTSSAKAGIVAELEVEITEDGAFKPKL
jgi:beta-glucosidase